MSRELNLTVVVENTAQGIGLIAEHGLAAEPYRPPVPRRPLLYDFFNDRREHHSSSSTR